MITEAPKGNWLPALFFIIIAAALSAVATYYVEKYLESKKS